MRSKFPLFLLVTGIVLCISTAPVHANILINFEYAGVSWGTMDIGASDSNSLSIVYTASSGAVLDPLGEGPSDPPLVTGFGFLFDYDPNDIDVDDATGGLDWVELRNLNAIPNPTNDPGTSKRDFNFGVTEGNPNNFSPPGIGPGETDGFFLDFASFGGDFRNFTDEDLFGFVELAAIRIQSVREDINEGSLFLVSEPATFLLLGAGLIGLAGLRRKFRTTH